MLARIDRVLCVGALATVGVLACAPATSSSLRDSRHTGSVLPLTPTSRVIDADRIQRSGSQSALDAIRALVPGYRALESRPVGTSWPGTSSMSRGSLRVIVDGHPVSDVESLRMIPARDVLAIHVLSAPDATIRFGPSFAGGAIVIQTLGFLRPME
jgi:outer membrane receptor for Fe3+-dicitrate